MKTWLFISLLVCTSCATTMLRKHYRLTVHTDRYSDTLIYENVKYTTPVRLPVKRSRNDLMLTLKSDTTTRIYRVKAVPNNTFIYGNLGGWYAAPVGHLIDLATPKRFTYGRRIRLSLQDTALVIKPHIGPVPHIKKLFGQGIPRYFTKSYLRKPGQLNLVLSSPMVSFYYMKTPKGFTSRTGCLGLGIGTEYYYNAQHYLAFSSGAAIDLPTPLPIAYESSGEIVPHDRFATLWAGITNNVERGRTQLGYGVHYNWYWLRMEYRTDDTDPSVLASDTYRSQALGVTLQAYQGLCKKC